MGGSATSGCGGARRSAPSGPRRRWIGTAARAPSYEPAVYGEPPVGVSTSRRSFWAWCLESEEPSDAERADLARSLSERSGLSITPRPIPDLADAELRPPRIRVPEALEAWCTTDVWERAFHAHGAHLTDRIRAFNLKFPNPPDVVAHPRDETELEATLAWCAAGGYVVVPYGGGSSVVWGVNPPEADAVVTIAMDRLDRVVELDEVSRAAFIEA